MLGIKFPTPYWGKIFAIVGKLYLQKTNYVRLRDLADAQKDDKLVVDWNAATKTVMIKSK